MKVKSFILCAIAYFVLCCPAIAEQSQGPTFIPSWEPGYISGSDGSEHENAVSAKTTNIIFLPAGSWINVNDENVTVAVMKYVDGVWDSMITPSLTTRSGKLRFQETAYVRLNYSYKDNPPIQDLNTPNSYIEIYANSGVASKWVGKTIAWFGTSISAGDGANLQSPYIVGEALGAIVYNEAVSSSGVRAGNFKYISKEDPMGYAGLYYASLIRSLSLSSTEKQAIFDNWATWQPVIPDAPVALPSAEDQTFAKNCSWDIKLAKYLTGGSVGPVDIYVFEHGHNDAGLGYDFNDLSTIPSDPLERSYYIGAMNFIFDKILSDNPKAKIFLIGHYENARKEGISKAQVVLSEKLGLPLCRTWEMLDWTQDKITKNGETKTVTQWLMPDDLHPHSDKTGEAMRQYTDALVSFFKTLE